DVEVPAENRVHEEGQGWTVAKYLLGHERMNTARIGTSQRELGRLKEFASIERKNGEPLIDDPRFRDKLSRVEIELMALSITNLRFLDQLRGGHAPGAEVSAFAVDKMNFDPSEEQRLFATSIERYVARDYTFETRRRIVASHDGYSRDVWMAFANLGLLGVAIPTEYGGLGGGAADLTSV